jgi:16S rRNA (guanine1207-N2)-methyltransferase
MPSSVGAWPRNVKLPLRPPRANGAAEGGYRVPASTRIRPSLWLRALPELGVLPGQRVLTVGMAEETQVASALEDLGAAVSAADWRRSALAAAVRGGLAPERVLAWDGAEGGPPGGEAFDLALCDLARLPGREAFLLAVRFAAPRLRPGGRLLVRGGNTEGVGGAGSRLREWFGAAETVAWGGHGRILACRPEPAALPPPPPAEPCRAALAGVALSLHRAPGVFNGGLPDAATQLLAGAVAADAEAWRAPGRACDVGCGGGALGLALLCRGAVTCALVDDSLFAARAATANAAANGLAGRAAVVAADAAAGIPGGPYDLVVSNPPFHSGPHEEHALAAAVARAAWEATGGRLYVVAPRFLRLERAVGGLEEIAADRAFRVLRAVRDSRGPSRPGRSGAVQDRPAQRGRRDRGVIRPR